MRKRVGAAIVIALSMLFMVTARPASADDDLLGFVATHCYYGYPCVGNGYSSGGAKVYNGRCGFQNMEDETSSDTIPWDRDSVYNYRTHGNPMILLNYVSGDPAHRSSYDWEHGLGIAAWESGSVSFHGYDAMMVWC
ncbi:hypothetical protein ACTWPT_46760 [Nonomuraea sp. 3N208]|uniref:hypothetical protein n=1 Tax=Nonomuraea sp. 3N208 TaxID=3457421 RepID=UPI003FD57180